MYPSKSVWIAYLKKNNRVVYNQGGTEVEWHPKFRRQTINAGLGNRTSIDFPNVNRYQICTLPWRQYDLGESYTKFQRLASQGKEGYFGQVGQGLVNDMVDDFMADLRPRFYYDGNSTSTPNDLHGCESWFSYSALLTSGYVGNPNDSYAGQSTALGQTGSWDTSAVWPDGATGCESEYCWFSPLIIDIQNALWGLADNSWYYSWMHCANFATSWMRELQDVDLTTFLMNPNLERVAKDSARTYYNLDLQAQARDVGLGFKRLNWEGIEITSERGVPANTAYMFDWDKFTLYSMQDDLIGPREQDYDLETSETLIAIDSYMQLICDSPAYTVKMCPITSGT